jgi:hypothetical protein
MKKRRVYTSRKAKPDVKIENQNLVERFWILIQFTTEQGRIKYGKNK